MAPITHRSRIHLLAAKEAPTIVILQRKRAKLLHIVTVDTKKHSVKEGSWFRGRIYEMKCDVSFDGEFMVYLAIGQGSGKFASWSELCRCIPNSTFMATLTSLSAPALAPVSCARLTVNGKR